MNINNDNTQTNINTKNNYINNNININLINNNYLDSTLKKSFLNNNIINNNYNININSLRMSYQKNENKFLVKTKQKLKQQKSNSANVKSLKEKYRNDANLLNFNTPNKISFDDNEEEDSSSSEKDSENTDSNMFLSPQMVSKKKNTKIISDIAPIKEDLFTKTIIAFLLDEKVVKDSNKNNNSISKYKMNKKVSNNNLQNANNIELAKDKLKGKRSSLCPGMRFQFKNRKKHVTFGQQKSAVIEYNIKYNEDNDMIHKKKYKINDDICDNNKYRNNNIKRIKLYDKNE